MRDASLLLRVLRSQLLLLLLSLSVVALSARPLRLLAPDAATAFTASSSSMALAETEATTATNTSSSSSVASADEQEQIRTSLREWYTSNFYENETQLLGLPNNRTVGLSPSEKPCVQLPSLQTRLSALKPNGRCPAKYANLSCTCLTGYIRDGVNEFWEFKVMKKTTQSVYPQNLDAKDVLEIDAITTIWAPGTLKGLYVTWAC